MSATVKSAAGKRIAAAVNGVVSYLASDVLGSVTEALSASGTTFVNYRFPDAIVGVN